MLIRGLDPMGAGTGAPSDGQVDVGGILIDRVTDADVSDIVTAGWRLGRGGVIVTPNVDIWRAVRRDPTARAVVQRAAVVVADGQPLVWASRISGDPLPARVTGSGLVETLSGLCASQRRSLYIIGGGRDDTASLAARALSQRHDGLRVAGTMVPPFGFDLDPHAYEAVVDEVVEHRPDFVFVGLGFPKQEKLALAIVERLPSAWCLGCGGGVAMAAGLQRRPGELVQRLGVEWVARLLQEPSRLAHRYLVDDVPAAVQLLGMSAARRLASPRARV